MDGGHGNDWRTILTRELEKRGRIWGQDNDQKRVPDPDQDADDESPPTRPHRKILRRYDV